jgi:hypothetical protein
LRILLGVLAVIVAGAVALAVLAVPLALALPGVAAVGAAGLSSGTPRPGVAPTGATVGSPAVAAGASVTDIPAAMLALYVTAARRCPGLPWTVLAAIGKVETDHGRGGQVSSAGAEGPMQFMPATWAVYGVDGDGDGTASIWDAADAVPAAADYLCANGGGDPARLANAIWNYNHADSYVRLVLAWAASYTSAATLSHTN